MNMIPHNADVRQELLDNAQTLMSLKGFSAVGLMEILTAAKVPKGSFYHYFGSKEAFGEALLERYFEDYLAMMDGFFETPGLSGLDRLMMYWRNWMRTQTAEDPQSKCLVVKLAAEVADLSDAMRAVLLRGTNSIIVRVTAAISQAVSDGSLTIDAEPQDVARKALSCLAGCKPCREDH